jgi:hypothetical protein
VWLLITFDSAFCRATDRLAAIRRFCTTYIFVGLVFSTIARCDHSNPFASISSCCPLTMTVTWGQNTVHTFGTPSPGVSAPAPLFGSSSITPSSLPSAPTFSFGASTSAPTPALAGGGLFGSTPAPSSGVTPSLFGASPAPVGGSLFGSTTPAPTIGNLFGNNAIAPSGGGLFGNTSSASSGIVLGSAPTPGTTLFGTPTQQQQQQQQIPAQAALMGYIDASARQETERVCTKLEKLFITYNGQEMVSEDNLESAKFVTITYNPLTREQKQMRYVAGGHHQIFEPPRPHQICGRDWKLAVVNNPDPDEYEPLMLNGSSSLQARVLWQQERATEDSIHANHVQAIFDFVRQRQSQTRQMLLEKEHKFAALRRRLLQIMTKVEIARSLNKPFQPDEYKAMQRLQALLSQVDQLRNEALLLRNQAKAHSQVERAHQGNVSLDGIPRKHLEMVLDEHRRQLQILTETAKKDRRDIELVGNRVMQSF